jgi:NAD-reducing hydrogenase large subunit
MHDYHVDANGLIARANLIVATGHNNWAMNRAVESVAKAFVHGPSVPEGMLNRVEAAVRCYDPCFSCSTHALGKMPLEVKIVDKAGRLLARVIK